MSIEESKIIIEPPTNTMDFPGIYSTNYARNGWHICFDKMERVDQYLNDTWESHTLKECVLFDIKDVIDLINRCGSMKRFKLRYKHLFIFSKSDITKLINDVKSDTKNYMYISGGKFSLNVTKGCFREKWIKWSDWKEQ